MAVNPIEMIIVGCGLPGRGMGWFHALQLLEGKCPSAKLGHIVEPWFLGEGATSREGEVFAALRQEWECKGVGFHSSVDTLPTQDNSRVALLAGRTAENPRLLREVVERGGCTHVILEKPGAPSVALLQEMASFALAANVPIFVDFNKNVSDYVAKAREAEAEAAGAQVKFVSFNAYSRDQLEECFERNAEGMLKNMAIHELALAATFYNVRVDNIDSVEVIDGSCECLTLGERTDFSKLDFTITTSEGKSVSIFADRCGGNGCEAIVSMDGKEIFRSSLPAKGSEDALRAKEAAHPNWMPYFFLQEDDYRTVKEMCASHVAAGLPGAPEGIATLEIAIQAMQLADFLTPVLQTKIVAAPSSTEARETPAQHSSI